ncbi:MAG: AsmA-like C-terminal region-containing protein, partial [Pseudomonadota bacterium]
EPLRYISQAGFDPLDFSGKGTFNLKITRPLLSYVPIEDYTFNGKGSFQELTLDLDRFSVALTEGVGSVSLTNKSLTIGGTAEAEGVPSEFSWERSFGDDAVMSLWARASLDSVAADAMGLPLRRYIRGEVDTRIEAEGDKAAFQRVQIVGDLTNAMISLDDQDSIKRIGEPGELAVTLQLGDEGEPLIVESMSATMAGANIEGNAKFAADGGLLDLDLPRLFVEHQADLSARLRRQDDMLVADLEGDYLYVGSLIDSLFKSQGGGGLPGGFIIDGALQNVDLKGAVSLSDVIVTGRHDGDVMGSLSLSGQFEDGGTLAINIDENPKGLGRDLTLVTDQFGKALEGAFGISSVTGGDAIFSATLLDDGPVAGSVKAQDIRLQNAPLVARLLSFGSLDGMARVLNGEGLAFDELVSDIQLEDGDLRFVNARLTGSALGLSSNGSVNLQEGAFDLRGAVAPAYGVNSFLADLPGIGELLVPRRGEGIFAFGYQVAGPMAEPTVSVNTFTALTPGILRRLFEPVVGQAQTTDDLLSAAEVTAGLAEARQYLTTPELLQEYERLHVKDEPEPDDVR